MLSAKSQIGARICALFFFILCHSFIVDASKAWREETVELSPRVLESSSGTPHNYAVQQQHRRENEGDKFKAQIPPQVSIADQKPTLHNTTKVEFPSSSTPPVFIGLRNSSLSVKGAKVPFVSKISINPKTNASNGSLRGEGLSLQESYDALKRKYSVIEFFVYSLCSVLAILTLAFACFFVSSNTSMTSKLLDLWQSHPLFPHSTKEDFNRHVQLQKTLREHCLEQERSSQMQSKAMTYLYTPPGSPILCNPLYTEDETPPWFRTSAVQAQDRRRKTGFNEENVEYELDAKRILQREYVFAARHNWAVVKVSFYQTVEGATECLHALGNWFCCHVILFSTTYLSILSPSLSTFYFLLTKVAKTGQPACQSSLQSKQLNSQYAYVSERDDIEVNASILQNGGDLDDVDDTDDDIDDVTSDHIPLVSKVRPLNTPQVSSDLKSTNPEHSEIPSSSQCFCPQGEIKVERGDVFNLHARLAPYYPSFIPFATQSHSITGLHMSPKHLKHLQSISNNLHIRLLKYLGSISFYFLTYLNFIFLLLFKAGFFILSLFYSFLCCCFCCSGKESELGDNETEKQYSQPVMNASGLLDLGSDPNPLRTIYQSDSSQRQQQQSNLRMERKHASNRTEDYRTNPTYPSSDHYFISLGNACDRRTSEEKIQAVCTLFSCEVSSYLNVDRFQAMPDSFSLTDSQKSARPSRLEKMERARKLNAHMNGETM